MNMTPKARSIINHFMEVRFGVLKNSRISEEEMSERTEKILILVNYEKINRNI